ncbi:MAG: aminomethyltransferase family protein, partial [Actinomycetota bacterium]|nr:aminomethyltransferase family protein [Actinomycetota bacterium]
CSDLLAFHAGKLQAGLERGLDATTTRSLMGNAYPQPGLFGKFYDQDQEPLVEVVRDTVGRHDTFGLACYAKYYEDMGYFGHVNCTDNFNVQLLPYTVASRKGWPALNLFFNTSFDANNLFVADEPWSRPGDYVLLRALTDLVCLSSACPDDVDPANAWNPTEVHVRVYPAKQPFSVAIARRVTPDAEPKLTKETGFHTRISLLTTRFTEYNGYWLPTAFDNHGAVAEYWACRERAAIMDLSPLRKWEVLGPDAEELLQATVTRDVRRLSDGQVVYTALCYDTGSVLDDATVFRLHPTNFRFVGGSEYDGIWLREQAERLALRVWVKESTDELHNVAVQGPASRDLLAPLIWTPPTQTPFGELKWFRFSVGRLGGPQGLPLIVSRTGYTGELGYELWCHPKDAPALWDAVMEAGEPHGLLPLGLEALDMLRIEAGLAFPPNEFTDGADPFEAGIGFTVTADKEDDFVGKEALAERRAHPQRTLGGLELEGNEPAAPGDCVHVGRQDIGVVTSGTRSPSLKRNIALCRMNVRYAELGTEVEVAKLDGFQKRIPATVVRFPFYDPDKTRPRS